MNYKDKRYVGFRIHMQGAFIKFVQRACATLFTRIQNLEPEISFVHSFQQLKHKPIRRIELGWLSLLALVSAIGLFIVAYGYTAAHYSEPGSDTIVWSGLLVIFIPVAVRILSPHTTRFERISLLCLIGICLYCVAILAKPTYFTPHDEFLHWRTAEDIANTRHLFSENAILPVSPFFPGLEIVTSAVSTMSGLSIFIAGRIVIMVSHLVMMMSLYLFYERITLSARMAGIATLIYTANPHFLFFDAYFSYESLALPLAIFLIFIMTHHLVYPHFHYRITFVAWLVLGAIVATHHMTDYVMDGLLILWAVMCRLQRSTRILQISFTSTALFGIIASITSIFLIGNPIIKYLLPLYGSALEELVHILRGTSSARQFFIQSGETIPLLERMFIVSSFLLIFIGLPIGWLCIWHRYRSSITLTVLGIASFLYPFTHLFRLTKSGSEITDRSAAFLFFPIACILAIVIAHLWPIQQLKRRQMALLTVLLTILFLGGSMEDGGFPWEFMPGPYLVGAEGRSVEPEGIQAAVWANSYLGDNKRIISDRINRLLMLTYGHEHPVTFEADGVDMTPIFFSEQLDADQLSLLQRAHVRYIVVDQRLSKALPSLGFYFEPGELFSERTKPIDVTALTKFNSIPQINRVFDSGDIVIYDVGGLSNAKKL
jgi:hypothetical protein